MGQGGAFGNPRVSYSLRTSTLCTLSSLVFSLLAAGTGVSVHRSRNPHWHRHCHNNLVKMRYARDILTTILFTFRRHVDCAVHVPETLASGSGPPRPALWTQSRIMYCLSPTPTLCVPYEHTSPAPNKRTLVGRVASSHMHGPARGALPPHAPPSRLRPPPPPTAIATAMSEQAVLPSSWCGASNPPCPPPTPPRHPVGAPLGSPSCAHDPLSARLVPQPPRGRLRVGAAGTGWISH